MRDVYGNATQVLIWLGEGTMESEEAFKRLRNIAALHESGALGFLEPLIAADVNKTAGKSLELTSPSERVI